MYKEIPKQKQGVFSSLETILFKTCGKRLLSLLGKPETTIRWLFLVQDVLDRLISERATAYGNGINPKHRLTNYHSFFISRIGQTECILDLGCGVGELARSIAKALPNAKITAIDSNELILEQARNRPHPANLVFMQGDITRTLPEGEWDCVVLSNVLEHIDRRIDFLRSILRQTQPKRLLIRVPLFERHWHVPLRRELGVNHLSDPTHFIEHSLEEFGSEMTMAGLVVSERVILWGEIWAVAEPTH